LKFAKILTGLLGGTNAELIGFGFPIRTPGYILGGQRRNMNEEEMRQF